MCLCVSACVPVFVRLCAYMRVFLCARACVCACVYLSICFSALYCVPATNQLQWDDASVQLYGQRVTVPERTVFIQRSVHAHN